MKEQKNNALEKLGNIVKKNGYEFDIGKISDEKNPSLYQNGLNKKEDAEHGEQEEKKEVKRRKNKGIKGLLTSVVVLGLSTLSLAIALTVTSVMPRESDRLLEANYYKSFYDTVEQVNNMDINLSKALSTKDSSALQGYLTDVAINSELCENDLQQLPLKYENKFYTTKLVNQIGDYSKYINKKLNGGIYPSEGDLDNLRVLYGYNKTLKYSLYDMIEQMGEDFSFSSIQRADSAILSGFNDLENLSVEYPELIYDGPFSDGKENKEIKGITGEEYSENSAKEKVIELFGEQKITDLSVMGESQTEIPCYNISATYNGQAFFCQISKKGGKLILLSVGGNCDKTVYGKEDATEKAQEFLVKQQINGMKAVWLNLFNNVYTINFVYLTNGVITYPDMVKVRVCAETLTVLGQEAVSYYTNHTEREIESATLTAIEAGEYVSSEINIETARLAIVPVSGEEKLCYEFNGTDIEGETFYVYIDAKTGKQVQMFKVIKNTEGELLM